jgi:hypothetical protein
MGLRTAFLAMCWIAAISARGQSGLEIFMNGANAQLEAQFGFGVTNIPIYSQTNPAIRYSGAIHYILQSAADAYDATAPTTNLPSVFRPIFSPESNGLWIEGYAEVTNDFATQMAKPFHAIDDPQILPDDNVWGVPWVVGAKGNIPAFNQYASATAFDLTRQLQFALRHPNTRPQFTNEFYLLTMSNAIGVSAWNSQATAYTNPVTIVISNVVSVNITNDAGCFYATNLVNTTAYPVSGWPGKGTGASAVVVPLINWSVSLPLSDWSVSRSALLDILNYPSFLPGDEMQTALPTYDWTVGITNHLIYALLDSGSGRILDFVNLSDAGARLDTAQLVASLSNSPPPNGGSQVLASLCFIPSPSASNSAVSQGVMNQINIGEGRLAVSDYSIPASEAYAFTSNLMGGCSSLSFDAPVAPHISVLQTLFLQAASPRAHYTSDDIGRAENTALTQAGELRLPLENVVSGALENISQSAGPVTVRNVALTATNQALNISFLGNPDFPFLLWTSTNLTDWTLAGTPAQAIPGQFQFWDSTTNGAARFYQVRGPK